MTIGSGTKQITGIVKQYDRLVISLFDSMYYAQYEEIDTKDSQGNDVTLITLRNYPLNDTIGCKQSLLGHKTIMALLDNSPVVINEKGMYVINQTNVRAETNASYISQRVQDWLDKFEIQRAYDLESKHEYWINGFSEEGTLINVGNPLPEGYIGYGRKEDMETVVGAEIGDLFLVQTQTDDNIFTQDTYRYSYAGWLFLKNEYTYKNEWLIYNYELNVFYKFAFTDEVNDIIEIGNKLYMITYNGVFLFDKNVSTFGKGKYDYEPSIDFHDKLGRQ